LTSSIDAGRLYVDLKLLVNCFMRSSQLLIVSFSNLLNHDLAALVRCNYKLCIAISFVPPNIYYIIKTTNNQWLRFNKE
jgi:hypothetical protein